MTGRIFDIEHGSFVDGPGIRTAVFFKGCNLKCSWCHNPESQSACRQHMHYRDKCIGCGNCRCEKQICDFCGQCVLHCPVGARKLVGEDMTVQKVMEAILEDRDFYGHDGGVTFTGGECMLQQEFLTLLLKACKHNGIHTAVDTAGSVPWTAFESILPYTDLFLYDVKIMDPISHKLHTGVDNVLILDNLARLLRLRKNVWVRIPVIPGINDTLQQMEAVEQFLLQHGVPEWVELLPYHAMGENKYAALGRKGKAFAVPDTEHMRQLCGVFKSLQCRM